MSWNCQNNVKTSQIWLMRLSLVELCPILMWQTGENVTPGTTIQSIHGFGIIQIVLTPA